LRAACLALACAILSSAAAYGVVELRIRNGDIPPVVNQVVLGANMPLDRPQNPAAVAQTNMEMTAADIYDMAVRQVVGIRTEAPRPTWFGEGGARPGEGGMRTAVTGSGFIISHDGYILTNYHVIDTAHTHGLPLRVFLYDGSVYDATVVGYDAANDVAVIKIETAGRSPAAIANSDNIRVGERVYAVGNPFGELVHTMTDGIVSALDRVVSVDGRSINTFQLSAAVNSGNSGGPVYDSRGEVIGIVTAKFMSGTVEGIGFAIPINDAIEIASTLIQHGYITGRPFMGITPRTVPAAVAEFYNWVVGVYVMSVIEGSAAETAGFMIGDIIFRLGDDTITSEESLRFVLRRFRAGDTTTVMVRRAGEDVELTITFDEDMSAGQPRQPQQPPGRVILP